jgi:hypothetical protein
MRTKEHLSVSIGEYLTRKGYVLCDITGVPFDGPVETNTLGVLTSEHFTPQRAHHFLIWSFGKQEPPKRIMLGFFRFTHDQNVFLEIFGRTNMESMMLLAHEIEINFKIKISARMSKDTTVFERLPDDQETRS